MAKTRTVLVEQVDEDRFEVWENADQPGKSVDSSCALRKHEVVTYDIRGWLKANGMAAQEHISFGATDTAEWEF